MDKIRPLGKREFLFPFIVLLVVSVGLMYVFYSLGFANGADRLKLDDPLTATSVVPLDESEEAVGEANYMYFISKPDFKVEDSAFDQEYEVDIYNLGERLGTMSFSSDYQTPIEHRFKLNSDGSELFYINEDNSAVVKLDGTGEESVVYEVETPYTYISSFVLDSDNDWFVLAHSEVPVFDNADSIVSTVFSEVEEIDITDPYLIRGVTDDTYIYQTNMANAPMGGGAATIVVTDYAGEIKDVDMGHNWILASNGEKLLISEVCDMGCDSELYSFDLRTLEYEAVADSVVGANVSAVLSDSVSLVYEVPFSYTNIEDMKTYTLYELMGW